jgi:hypothetical protein
MFKKFILTFALCFAFAITGHADMCSELCNECEKSQLRDVSTCCQAESDCYINGIQKCVVAKGTCKRLESGAGSGDNYDNHQHYPVFNERQVRQEVREVVDMGIRNYQ